jgi:hypothetical protein
LLTRFLFQRTFAAIQHQAASISGGGEMQEEVAQGGWELIPEPRLDGMRKLTLLYLLLSFAIFLICVIRFVLPAWRRQLTARRIETAVMSLQRWF